MAMHKRQIIATAAALWVQGATQVSALPLVLGPPRTLEEMARRVEHDFPEVAQLTTGELAAQLAGAETIRLFDVRERAEFDVSHLSGAERIGPDISTAAALAQIGARAEGAVLVFYCSVGQRRSRLAFRTQHALGAAGAQGVYNLRGGVFAWHNETRPLVNRLGRTQYVHPYNAAWRRLLTHPDMTAFAVRSAAL